MGVLFSVVMQRRRVARSPFLEARWHANDAGGHDLQILAGGDDLDVLDAAIKRAFALRAGPACELLGFSRRIVVGILPALTSDTAECRRWRMRLQRELRTVGGHLGLAISVEYDAWKGVTP